MAKLYPPVIESTVPACYDEKGMVKFTVPFTMNRAVSAAQIGGFELKIKTVQTGSFLYTISTINPANYKIDETESYVIFYLKDIEKKLKVGQFYKVQLAYIGMDISTRNQWYNSYMSGNITLEEYEAKITTLGVTGYYSGAGAIKYTTKPKVFINDFNENSLNEYTHNYIGYYSQENGDISERVYSYQFNIYDSDGKNIILSSGECIHNSSTDTNPNISSDNYSIMQDLQYYKIYYVEYIITTINKMVISSPKYRIVQRETINPDIEADLSVIQNFNNGYINIGLVPHKDFYLTKVFAIIDSLETNRYQWLNTQQSIIDKGFTQDQAMIILQLKDKIINLTTHSQDANEQYKKEKEKKSLELKMFTVNNCTGSFILCRADEDSFYANWEELYRFKLFEEIPDKIIYSDFMTVQGKKYQYSLQQYNDYGLFSKRIYSDIIVSDFEDAFLYDGIRQLKIRYNPKMTKFTNTVLEQKQETIGGKYPFIFRNGHVNYHEFPIAGLISYLSDDEFLFISKEELNLADEYHRHETKKIRDDFPNLKDSLSENIVRERVFKTQVLEWLNNGQPKLFRSPTEGNFLVRLMKVSLTPENKLGRMLHNFSSTAYEIADFNNENLIKLGFININNKNLNLIKFFTRDLSQYAPNATLNTLNNIPISIVSLKCEDMFFGDEILITYEDGEQETIKIGLTGNYYIDQIKTIKGISVMPRYKIAQINESNYSEKRDLLYLKNENNEYEKLDNQLEYNSNLIYYQVSNNPLKGSMTFGYYETEKNNFSYIKNVSYLDPTYRQFIGEHKNIIDDIQSKIDVKKQFTEWYFIKAEPRPIDKIIQSGEDDDTLYYYGADEFSDKVKFSEIKYPIGLRVYEPGKYYKYINDTEFTNEEYSIYSEISIEEKDFLSDTYYIKNNNEYTKATEYNPGMTYYINDGGNYYMYGKYELVNEPIGKFVYEPGKYYIKSIDDSGEDVYNLAYEEFDKNTVYYSRYYDNYNIARYSIVKYLTKSKDYVFERSKFYRKIDDGNNKYYTLSNSFVEEWELNKDGTQWQKPFKNNYYYIFIDMPVQTNESERSVGEGYHNAYATISDKYLYKSRQYYMEVLLTKADLSSEISYVKCNSSDFNIHGINKDNDYPLYENYEVTYEPHNKETIKYYAIKPILPCYIHQIGSSWEKIDSAGRDVTGNNTITDDLVNDNQDIVPNDIIFDYKFNPQGNQGFIGFIDFNNNMRYDEYEPWIEINGQRIRVDDTLIFYQDDLKNIENITTFALGNGVIVDVGYQLKNIDYLIEDEELAAIKNQYLEKVETLNEKYNILLDPSHEKYIDLSKTPEDKELITYNAYMNHTWESSVISAYDSLVAQIRSRIV